MWKRGVFNPLSGKYGLYLFLRSLQVSPVTWASGILNSASGLFTLSEYPHFILYLDLSTGVNPLDMDQNKKNDGNIEHLITVLFVSHEIRLGSSADDRHLSFLLRHVTSQNCQYCF